MVKLCEFLGISVNELLSGERIRVEDAIGPSEESASADEPDATVRRKWMIYFFTSKDRIDLPNSTKFAGVFVQHFRFLMFLKHFSLFTGYLGG